MKADGVVFRKINSFADLTAIQRLNHSVFANEIGQHSLHESCELVDRFDARNTYFVAEKGQVIVGMICATHTLPGQARSIEEKLSNPQLYSEVLSQGVEIRLLAVDSDHRQSSIALGLIRTVSKYALRSGYRYGFVSGIQPRDRLYEKLGFKPMAEVKTIKGVSFVPMMLDMRSFLSTVSKLKYTF